MASRHLFVRFWGIKLLTSVQVRLRGFWLKHWLDTTPRAQIAESYGRLATLVAEGALRAPVEATYPLEQYRDALAHAAQAGRTGKVLFTW